MKKLFVVLTAMAMIFGVAAGAYAANQVQITLTSPTIIKQGCEKAGSVTFAFDGNSTINAGDWWYMDLPSTVTICKPFDYLITGAAAAGDTVDITGGTSAMTTPVGAAGIATSAWDGGALGPAVQGPLTVTNAGGAVANTGLTYTGGTEMVFRVVGSGRRVTITAYGDAGAQLTVATNTKFSIKILDGDMQNAGGAAGPAVAPANILRDTVIAPAAAPNGIYGDALLLADMLAGPEPDVSNTLCINAEAYSGDLVFVSFASLNDKFTFTGDSQIAHLGAANNISLTSCKGEITGDILIGGQGTCTFDYETAAGYGCGFTGNRIIIQGTSTFGEAGDKYSMTITSDTTGVYLGAAATIGGFTPVQATQCSAAGAAVAAAFTPWTATTNVGVAYPGSCTFTSTNRIVKIATAAGNITAIDAYDKLYVDLPLFYYDSSIIGNGTEVDVTITLGKYPCGDFFTGSRTIGTFVTTCPVGAGATTLMYPFMPAMDGSTPGWWGGFTINNAGTTDGTAELTFQEADGDTATYTTPVILAGGIFTMPNAQLLAAVTPAATNAGTFGDANVMITVVCNFGRAGGFAFTGNGEEGTGYTAYVLGATGWQ